MDPKEMMKLGEMFFNFKEMLPELDNISVINELHSKLVSDIQDLSDSKLREMFLKFKEM